VGLTRGEEDSVSLVSWRSCGGMPSLRSL
jgi:hypothetical protein